MSLGRTVDHHLSFLSLSQCRSTIGGSSALTLDMVPFTRKPESKPLRFSHKFAPNAHSRVISTSKRSWNPFIATRQNEILRCHSIHNTVEKRRCGSSNIWRDCHRFHTHNPSRERAPTIMGLDGPPTVGQKVSVLGHTPCSVFDLPTRQRACSLLSST
jgi:hypothetical protein